MFEEYMKHISINISQEVKDFVDNEVFRSSEYLFYKNSNDSQIAYCTKCNHEFTSVDLHHNETGICPICGHTVTAKSLRYKRGKCFNDACFYFFEKSVIDPSVVVCKGYYVSKDYTDDYKNPKEDYMLEAIYIFEEERSRMLKLNYSYFDGAGWNERKSVFDFNQGWLATKMCYCSFDSIEKAIHDTSYQYIPYKMFAEHYSMVKLFEEYQKHPWIEQISKIGFKSIVEAKLDGDYIYNCLNYKGRDIFHILKLTHKDLKEIRKSGEGITPLFLSLYQLQAKDKSGLSPEEVKNIEGEYGAELYRLKNILKYVTMKKALKYMETQYTKYKSNYYAKSQVAITWDDYLADCKRLEMSLKDEHVLFPKNLYINHQNTIRAIKVKENKGLDTKIRKRLKSLKKYDFEFNGLMIRAAKSSIELIDEGQALHHCVATYAGSYAKGQTNIMVIRKISEPDKPYFTLELRNNKVAQCYGNHDCIPKEDVKKFVDVFKKEKLSGKKEINNKIRIPA